MKPIALAGVLVLPLVPRAPLAQEVEPLILEGDVLGGFLVAGDVLSFAVNAEGSWVARVRNQALFGQDLLVVDGAVALKEDALWIPAFDVVESIQGADLDAGGVVTSGLDLKGGGALYHGGAALDVPDPIAGLAWAGFDDVCVAGPTTLCVRGALADPLAPGSERATLVRLELDPATGAVAAAAPLATEGEPLLGLALGTVTAIAGTRLGFAADGSGATIFAARTELGGIVVSDGAAIALDGGPSPIPGFTWDGLLDAGVDRNAAGDVAIHAGLAPFGEAIARNGEVVAKVGSPLPAIVPYVIDALAAGVRLSDAGDVVWAGTWDHPDPAVDGGLFRGTELLVREGETTAGGVVIARLVDALAPHAHGPDVSADGRYVVFWAELADGREGLFRLDLGAVEPVPGCLGNPGALAHAGGLAVPGGTLALALDDGQAAGAATFVAISTAAAGAGGCGAPLAGFGELLVDLAPGHLVDVASGPAWTAAAAPLALAVPANPSLAGLELVLQGAFVDVAGLAPGEPVRATNALAVTLGT